MTDVMDRLISRLVLDESGCWLWPGAVSRGYGQLGVGGKLKRVHRLTYEYFRGVIPEGLTLDHLCRVRRCANPWHCEPVTNRENTLRGEHPSAIAYREGRCKRGHQYEQHGRTDAHGHHYCRLCKSEWQRANRAAVAA